MLMRSSCPASGAGATTAQTPAHSLRQRRDRGAQDCDRGARQGVARGGATGVFACDRGAVGIGVALAALHAFGVPGVVVRAEAHLIDAAGEAEALAGLGVRE